MLSREMGQLPDTGRLMKCSVQLCMQCDYATRETIGPSTNCTASLYSKHLASADLHSLASQKWIPGTSSKLTSSHRESLPVTTEWEHVA